MADEDTTTTTRTPAFRLPKPATLDHLKKKPKPECDFIIYLDEESAADVEQLDEKIEELTSQAMLARMTDNAAAEVDLDLRIERLKAERAPLLDVRNSNARSMHFKALGRKKYSELVDAHPPTDANIEKYRKALKEQAATNPQLTYSDTAMPEHDPDTFPPALIAACSVTPKLSAAEVSELVDDWTDEEFVRLYATVMALNTKSRVATWGNGYG